MIAVVFSRRLSVIYLMIGVLLLTTGIIKIVEYENEQIRKSNYNNCYHIRDCFAGSNALGGIKNRG
jgi:hypothetical protein